MPTLPLVSDVVDAVRLRGAAEVCLVCGRRVSPRDERVRLRRNGHVHRACATYEMRRVRRGASRLGYPRS